MVPVCSSVMLELISRCTQLSRDCIPCNRDLADCGLTDRGSKQAVVFVHSIIYINSLVDCYFGLITELWYHKQ